MAAAAVTSDVSDEQRVLLERWVRAHVTPKSVAIRARIVLLASAGHSNSAIARDLDVSRPTVIMWRERFRAGGPHALCEIKAGRGRKRTITARKVKEIVVATTQTTPPGDKAIRRGVFYSVPDLIAAIQQYLDTRNEDPKPFVWTAWIDSIFEKVNRWQAVLETVH